MQKIKALGNRVLIRVDEVKEETTQAGIVIAKIHPKSQLEMATCTGKIVQIGSRCDDRYLEGMKVGDRVIFSRYEGCAREIDGELYRIIYDDCVWGTLEEGA